MYSATGPDRALDIIQSSITEADLAAWIDQYGNGILRLCFLQLGDYALAEDAVQETFIRVWQNYASFEHRCSIKTWITTIAINVCRSLQRSPWHRRTLSIESIPEPSTNGEMPDYTVSQAVMKLPKDLKDVFLMHELQGIKLREIAQAKHLPLSTVSSRLSRARTRLRKELKEWYPYEGIQ